jgi:hypothetical protein
MFGLHWVRRRQRDLAKAVLALFCLAWLQAAAVPCVMADDVRPVTSQATPMASAHHDCRYCPPLEPGAPAGADHQGTCVYPHEPQVDARASSGLFFIVPVAQHIATLSFQPIETIAAAGPLGDVVSRTPLAVSYCRFIE